MKSIIRQLFLFFSFFSFYLNTGMTEQSIIALKNQSTEFKYEIQKEIKFICTSYVILQGPATQFKNPTVQNNIDNNTLYKAYHFTADAFSKKKWKLSSSFLSAHTVTGSDYLAYLNMPIGGKFFYIFAAGTILIRDIKNLKKKLAEFPISDTSPFQSFDIEHIPLDTALCHLKEAVNSHCHWDNLWPFLEEIYIACNINTNGSPQTDHDLPVSTSVKTEPQVLENKDPKINVVSPPLLQLTQDPKETIPTNQSISDSKETNPSSLTAGTNNQSNSSVQLPQITKPDNKKYPDGKIKLRRLFPIAAYIGHYFILACRVLFIGLCFIIITFYLFAP
jgi:hypothetical protein